MYIHSRIGMGTKFKHLRHSNDVYITFFSINFYMSIEENVDFGDKIRQFGLNYLIGIGIAQSFNQ